MAVYTSFPPPNQHEHHSICISFLLLCFLSFLIWQHHVRLSLPGTNGNSISVPVLDDTGSCFLEIFDADRIALNIPYVLLHVHPPVTLVTTSALVQRNVIFIQVKILDQTNSPISGLAGVGSCDAWTSKQRPMMGDVCQEEFFHRNSS